MIIGLLLAFTYLWATVVDKIECAVGSEKDVHFLFLPTESSIRVATDRETFHSYDPQCVKITDALYPCNTIEYPAMRMPNLLGQTTIAEVKSFIYSFGGDELLSCDPYARSFLCSLVTPLCFNGKPQLKIPPCREFCERVRDNCFYQLEEVGLGIPSSFNCSKFENENMCMDPAKSSDTSSNPTPAPRPKPSETTPKSVTKPSTKNDNDDDVDDYTTDEKNPEDLNVATTGYKDGEQIVTASDIYAAVCYNSLPSTIIIRGRLKSIREKRKGLYMKVREKNLKVFYDKFTVLGELDDVPTYNGLKVDQMFFRTYAQVDEEEEALPAKTDVVYFFISRIETDNSGDFFRVQYMVSDTGSSELRRLMNEVKDIENPLC